MKHARRISRSKESFVSLATTVPSENASKMGELEVEAEKEGKALKPVKFTRGFISTLRQSSLVVRVFDY